MLKKPITFRNLDGETVTETHYFHLTEAEVIEAEYEIDGGLTTYIQRVVDAQNEREIIAVYKKLLLLAYGKRSEDGKRFIKNDELRLEFTQNPAYSALFMELATDHKAAAEFTNGIMPVSEKEQVQDKPLLPPPSPASVVRNT